MTKSKKELIEYLKKELEKIDKEIEQMIGDMGEDYYKPLKKYNIPVSMHELQQKTKKRTEKLLNDLLGLGKSEGRQDGIAKARTARTNKTKEKVQNAINLLRIEGKEITPYQVAKVADISFNTAKKYLATI